MRVKKRLGEILVEAGLLSEDQLRQALLEQKNSNLKLGQFLVRKGAISEGQIMDLLSRQLKIERFDPAKFPLDLALEKMVPAEIAQKHQLVPLKKTGFLLKIAMADPLDINALDKVEELTHTEVEPVICTEQELRELLNSLYGTYSDLDGVMERVEEMEVFEEGEAEKAAAEEVSVTSLHDLAEEAPVIRLVNSVLSQAIREGASDVHFSPERNYVQLQFRVDGKLHNVPSPPKSMFLPIVSRIKILANLDIATSRIPQDGRFSLKMDNKEINVRVSTLPTIYGENLVLRLLDTSSGIYSLEHLGMSAPDMQKIRALINKPYGMILSTGPTGSGKSSSLYAILREIYKPEINIITLEDPVEYRMEKIRQVQLNRKAGMTFASGLRAILRQDPDVIMVGEIRDVETAAIAVQAAMTGHLVLATVHTNDAAGAITRLLDMGIEPFLVSSVMLLSFAQRLIRKICPHCKEPHVPPAEALDFWGFDKKTAAGLKRGKGCFQCKDKGYKGRTGIFEALVIDDMVREMILQRKSSQEITRAVKAAGKLRTLKDDAADKILKGITSIEEGFSAVVA